MSYTNATHVDSDNYQLHQRGSKDYKNENNTTGVHNDAESVSANELLAVLGYQSELLRTRSTWQVAFMAFVLSSIPYGLSTTFFFPLTAGGPVAVVWGLVVVILIILCLAISLGEITSVYPTAGGVYYQTFMLSGAGYRRVAAWICGWAYVLGNITITLSVNFGTCLFFIGCVNIFTDEEGNGIWQAETYQIWLVFVVITLLCNATSALGNKWLPLLDTVAIYWTFAGVIAIIVCVLAIAKNGRNSGDYVFTAFENSSGWRDGWAYCIGLLQGAYVTSATGMIISMCEETQQPAVQVPRAMIGALLMEGACGLIFLICLLFVLPPIAEVLGSPTGQPLPVILKSAIGNSGGAFALTIPIIVLGILCGIACTTASSRCTWAFARDGAIPGSTWWKKVNAKLDVPLNAMMLCMVVEILLGLIYFGSVAAFNAFANVGIVFLTLSYVMPVIASLIGGRKHLKQGHYDFGAFGIFCNVVSIAWALFIIPVACMPAAIPVTGSTMNYAAVVFVGGTMVSAIWYVVWGRKNYRGPPTDDETIRRHSV
ncbi:hypothetical protein H2198_003065 [Neophaeococcomyces mojaviensis]|uniref:Uncharacterized protein n=1 Tax=Neophaeococcomyces mojaviensis TaxID=3383035 RepID=A0ACC3ACA6_9EURO|nr:hypothetical protein H2198_003065 [Knufia sp. JES_112]